MAAPCPLWVKSRHLRCTSPCPLYPDICSAIGHVCFGPKADSCSAAKRIVIPRVQSASCSLVLVRRHYCLGRLFGLKGVDQDLGGRSGRGRVLAGDQQSVGDDVDTPVFDLGESGTEAEQLVLDEERHDLGQANIRLLTVGEPGHLLALDQRLAGGGLYVAQDPGGMADQRHKLSGGKKRLDQLDGIRVFGQIPHWTVASRIEDSVVVFLFHTVEAYRLIELALRVRV